jgi:hypothetical protein
MPVGRSGAIVVRGRESRPHGEGPQWRPRGLLVEPPLERGCCIITSTSPTRKDWAGLRAQDRIAYRAQQNLPLTRLFRTMTWSAFAAKSIEHVLQNKGARTPGVDGKTKNDYSSAESRLTWQRELIRSFRSDTFRPLPARRVYILKPNKPGEKRPLGIPPLTERVVQDMLRQVLEPVFESRFTRTRMVSGPTGAPITLCNGFAASSRTATPQLTVAHGDPPDRPTELPAEKTVVRCLHRCEPADLVTPDLLCKPQENFFLHR